MNRSEKKRRNTLSFPISVSAIGALTLAAVKPARADLKPSDHQASPGVLAENFVILDNGNAFFRLQNGRALVLSAEQFAVDAQGHLVLTEPSAIAQITALRDNAAAYYPEVSEADSGAIESRYDADQPNGSSPIDLDANWLRLQASNWSPLTGAESTCDPAGAAGGLSTSLPIPVVAGAVAVVGTGLFAVGYPATQTPVPVEPGVPDGGGAPSEPTLPPGPDVFSGFDIDLTGGAWVSVTGTSIGDVNHDQIDDWIVSASALSTNETTTYVIFGREGSYASDFDFQSLDAGEGFALDGIEHENSLDGVATATAGDVNGDGIDDLIIGSPQTDSDETSGAGKSYVVFGKNVADDGDFPTRLDVNNGLNGTNGFAINGGSLLATSGSAVSTAGDINADGVDDIIIGAPGENGLAGRSYVVFGKNVAQDGDFPATFDLASLASPDSDGSTGFAINGIADGDQSGSAISHAGDINGDGIADVIIGAYKANSEDGQSYVVFGKDSAAGETFNPHFDLSALDGRNGFVINGVSESGFAGRGHRSGFSVSSAGDINGDGIDDVVVGAPTHNGSIGASYVVFGKNVAQDGDFSPSLDLASLMTSDSDGRAGFMISINSSEGRDTEIVDRELGISQIGYSVSDAGDVNRDGLDDLIIGAPWTAYGTTSFPPNTGGVAYVVFGSSNHSTANLDLKTDIVDGDGNRGFVILSPEPEDGYHTRDLSGFSVSSVGDINKDGFGDILIGNSGTAEESHVIFGMDNFAPFVYLEDLAGLA